MRPQGVHHVLPVAGVGCSAGPDVADQPGEAQRASGCADGRPGVYRGGRARPAVLAGEQRVARDGVDDRVRVRAGQRDGHVEHAQAGAEHGDGGAVRGGVQRARLPRVGDVAVLRDGARHRWRQVADRQHDGVGVDPAVRGQVQAQCAAVAMAMAMAMAMAPDRHDVRGDAADPRRWPCRSFGRREAVGEVAAVGPSGQEPVMRQPGGGCPAGQVARVADQRAHCVRGGIQQVGGMRGGVGLAEPVAAVPVDQGDSQRRSPARGLAKQVDGGQRAAGPAADDCDQGPRSARIIC